jgi:hypothetical protein
MAHSFLRIVFGFFRISRARRDAPADGANGECVLSLECVFSLGRVLTLERVLSQECVL